MSLLLHELATLCLELRSDKYLIRNKAVDKIQQLLTDAKKDFLEIFCNRRNDATSITYAEVFTSAVEAVFNVSVSVVKV